MIRSRGLLSLLEKGYRPSGTDEASPAQLRLVVWFSKTGGDEERPHDRAPACGDNSGGFGGWRDWLLAVCAVLVLVVALAMFVASVGHSRGIFSLPLEIALPVSLVGLSLAVWANRRRRR